MNKRIAISIALFTASVICAQNAAVPAAGSVTATVGRNRMVTEGVSTTPVTAKHRNVLSRVVRRVIGKKDMPTIIESRLPGKHNLVTIVASHPKFGCFDTSVCGDVYYQSSSHNIVTNAGLNWLADQMSKTTAPSDTGQCNWIALTTSAFTPGAGDTTLSGEMTTLGMSRTKGTYTHSANATTYTIANIFTATGTVTALQAGGVFTASTGGTMCFEDTFTPATLTQSGDTISVTWVVTI